MDNMRVILDASAILCVVLEEQQRDSLVIAVGDAELICPSTTELDIANALSRMVKNKGKRDHSLNSEEALRVWALYRSLPIKTVKADMDETLRLAVSRSMFSYDASYLELASRLNVPLVTLDGGMKQAARELKISCLEV
jgi:predicted nucleic acid-binding protein